MITYGHQAADPVNGYQGYNYFIVWPDRDEVEQGGRAAVENWLNEHEQLGNPPTSIVAAPPAGAKQLAAPTSDDRVELRGSFRNSRDLITDIALGLGPDFPPFRLHEARPAYELHFQAELTDEQLIAIEKVVDALVVPADVVVVCPSDGGSDEWFTRWPQGDIDIVPSRAIPKDLPRAVRWLVEEDEEYWLEHRRSALLANPDGQIKSHVPDRWTKGKLRCVIDASIYPPGNIRSYLTLYDVVTLVPPIETRIDDILTSLGITRAESVELIGTGRLQVALPQSVDRYDGSWLASVAESHPHHLMASRRLACAMLQDSRARMPFLGPDLEPHERQRLAHAVRRLASDPTCPTPVRAWFAVLNQQLADTWCFAPLAVHRDGAMQATRFGLGWLVAEYFKSATGLERTLEIMKAADAVEIAGALDAVAIPAEVDGFREEAYTNLIAAVGAPVGEGGVPVADPREVRVAQGLLAVDNDVPVVEFATSFAGPDVDRLRSIVRDLLAGNQDDDYLNDALRKYNDEVRRYEARPSRLQRFNVAGFAASAATAAGAVLAPESVSAIAPFVPLGVWLLGLAAARGAESTGLGGTTGRLWDAANGFLAAQPARAVLVSRLRSQVALMKK